jgi:hypothetical protein
LISSENIASREALMLTIKPHQRLLGGKWFAFQKLVEVGCSEFIHSK